MMPMQMPGVAYDLVPLAGGLDQLTPTLSLKPGVAREATNFEASETGGYRRVAGYERYDGRPAPSEANYTLLTLASFTNVPAVGQTVTGQTSAATGVVAAVGANVLAVTKTTGTFTTEVIKVGATTIGTLTLVGGTVTSQQDAIFLNAAADIYRADIAAVPGSGSVLGVAVLSDVVYAFRNNAGGTAAVLHKTTSGGWTAVTMYREVSFTAGAGSIADAQTVTRGANTATIKRVVIETGTLEAGTAAGRLIITAPAPGAFAAGSGTTSGGGTLTISGADTAITFLPNGRFEFDRTNFSGTGNERLYGCDGVSREFEFDGDVLVPLNIGTTTRAKHVAAFQKHLFWGVGSSLIHSRPGGPYDYQALTGASEIATGADITGLTVLPGGSSNPALAAYNRSNISVLYGTGTADWNLVSLGLGVGAIRYSTQSLAQTYGLDDRGVMSLQASQNFGNFDQASLTANIRKIISDKRTKVAASLVNREKSQYRLLFNDGTGLFLTIVNDKFLGAMPMQFAHTFTCAFESELSNGAEASFVGGSNGFVYQLEKGTSFDGEDINASVTLNYNPTKSPRIRKRYRKASIEVSGDGYAAIAFGYTLGYGSSEIEQPGQTTYSTPFQSARWDSFVWDAFVWDGRTLAPTEADMQGTAENVAIVLGSATDYIPSYTLNSIITHYTVRRGLR